MTIYAPPTNRWLRDRINARKVRFTPTKQENTMTTQAPAQAAPDARLVPPGSLVIAANVRADTKVDKTFVANIKQHGVLVPILVEEIAGDLAVLDGQRRTLAALEAGIEQVPVIVVTERASAEARIIEQLVVNDHREDLTDGEHTNAFGQLALLGMSADNISRKTNLPKKRVELAVSVAQSDVAGKAMVEHQLTLDQAAVILEFEDNPLEVTALAESVKTGQFDHTASQIRQARLIDRLTTEKRTDLEAEGLTIWEGETSGYSDKAGAARRIDYLRDSKGKSLTVKSHADCPNRVVSIEVNWQYVGGGERQPKVEKLELCSDWKSAGHIDPYKNTDSKPEPGTPEADAAAALRRLTLANNKLWQPATEVRLAFIRELLQRRELPGGWELYVANHFATASEPARHQFFMKAVLGINEAESLATWLQASPTKAPTLLIAFALTWPEDERDFAKSGWRSTRAQKHLVQLSRWGYTLSELEERVVQGTATQVA